MTTSTLIDFVFVFCSCAVNRVQRPVLYARYPAGHGVAASRSRVAAVAGQQPVAVPAAAVAATSARHRPHIVRRRHRVAGRPARASRQAPQTPQVRFTLSKSRSHSDVDMFCWGDIWILTRIFIFNTVYIFSIYDVIQNHCFANYFLKPYVFFFFYIINNNNYLINDPRREIQ